MFREDLESKELEIIRTASLLPKKNFVVIGGYAASALSIQRFSMDCDIVISDAHLKEFRDRLRAEGYRKHKSASGFDETYRSEVEIYVKDVRGTRVSIDLFVNGVTSSKTKGSWSFEYIMKNSTEAIVSGARNSASVTVPAKELLMAMKIHSGRDVDMCDIVMLSEGVDWGAVLKHAAPGRSLSWRTSLHTSWPGWLRSSSRSPSVRPSG